MNPARDNPVIRFNTFWWGLWTFLLFAVVLAVVVIWNHRPPSSLEEAVAVARYATKAQFAEAQSGELSAAEIEAAIAKVAADLPSSKPVAVEKPEQVVPGSPTALKLAAATAAPSGDSGTRPAPDGAPASAGNPAPEEANPAKDEAKASKDEVNPPTDEAKPSKEEANPSKDEAKASTEKSKPSKDESKSSKKEAQRPSEPGSSKTKSKP